MVNLVFSSKLFSELETAYQINSRLENGKVEFKRNKEIIHVENEFWCSCKIFHKKTNKRVFPLFGPKIFL